MEKELVIKKCSKCNTLIEVIKDCNCDNCIIKCCGEEMIELVPNSVDAAFEKHVPNYEVIDNRIIVTVNHIMEEDHFIEWIAMSSNNKIIKKFLLQYFHMLKEARFILFVINMDFGQKILNKYI